MPRRGAKKFTTFKWKHEGMEVEVPVWVIDRTKFPRSTSDYYESDEPTVSFEARLRDHEHIPPFTENDVDINKLRDKVVAELERWYDVDWDLFLMVETSGHHTGQHSGHTVTFQYEFYVVGKRSDDVTVHMRVPEPWGGIGNKYETWDGKWDGVRWNAEYPHEGLPRTGPSEKSYSIHLDDTRALVPATKENVAAARRFKEVLEGLGNEMEHHFHPDRIENLLDRILKLPKNVKLLSGRKEL